MPVKKQICPWKFLPNHARETQFDAREKKREKHARETTKVPVKKNQILQFLISGKFIFFGFFRYRTYQVGVPYHNFYPWKKNNANFAREKKRTREKKSNFCPWKWIYCPWKNQKKCPWKRKMGVKKLKNGPKSGRENNKVPVKKSKKRPKMVFTGTFFFTGKKKTLHQSTQ